MYLSTFP